MVLHLCSLINNPQATLTPNSLAAAVCTPELATDGELLIWLSFYGQCLFKHAHPTPILFYFSVRRKWSHNQNKKSSNTFCLLCPPPSSLYSPQKATPPQLGSNVTSLSAWGRNDEQGLWLQISNNWKTQTSVKHQVCTIPKPQQWHCHWKNLSTPLT